MTALIMMLTVLFSVSAVGVVLGVRSMRAARKKLHDQWRLLSEETQGEFVVQLSALKGDLSYVSAQIEGREVRIDRVLESAGESAVFAYIRAKAPCAAPWSLRLGKSVALLTKARDSLAGGPIETGDVRFDQHFALRSDDAREARAVFGADAELRAALLALPAIAVRAEKGHVIARVLESSIAPESHTALMRIAATIAHRMESARGLLEAGGGEGTLQIVDQGATVGALSPKKEGS